MPHDLVAAADHHAAAPSSSRMASPWHCTAVMALVIASLKVRGFGRTLRAVRRFAEGGPLITGDHQAVVEGTAHNLVVAAVFFPVRARCLEQSLTLFALLRRRGVDVRFKIGAQPYRFRAHAWVEYRGVPVNENGELVRGLVTLPELPI
jgi:hypothetical protein